MSKVVRWTTLVATLAVLSATAPLAARAQTPAPAPVPSSEAKAVEDAERDINSEIELTRASIQLRLEPFGNQRMDDRFRKLQIR